MHFKLLAFCAGVMVGFAALAKEVNADCDLATDLADQGLNIASDHWSIYGNHTYTLAHDVTMESALWLYPNTASPLTFDFSNGNHTLKTPAGGISFVHQAGSVVYKGGTWDFSAVPRNGYVRLLGHGVESIVSTPDKYVNQHALVDGATIKAGSTASFVIPMVGTGLSTVTLKGATLTASGTANFYAASYTPKSVAAGGVSNTLNLTEGTRMTVPAFYADFASQTPSVPTDVAGTIVVDNSTVILTGTNSNSGTLYLGQAYSGNTMIVTNKATVTVGGYGCILGVNNANSWSNTLEIADGGQVKSTSSVSIGHSNGSSWNRVIVRKGGVLNAPYVNLDNFGSMSTGWLGHNNVFETKPGASVTLTTTSTPFTLRGNESRITLGDGGTYTFNSTFYLNVQTNAAGKLVGCTNNTFEVLAGTTFKAGMISCGIHAAKVPAIGTTLVVGNDAKLLMSSQLYASGPNNSLVVSNGFLQTTYNSPYTFYWGNANGTLLGGSMEGSRVVLAGDHPQIVVTNNVEGCVSLSSGTVVEWRLPESGTYAQPPIQCGVFTPDDSCRFAFPNISVIRSQLSGGNTRSWTLVDAITKIEPCSVNLKTCASQLPEGCSLSIVTNSATQHPQLVLKVTPVAVVDGTYYYTYAEASAALKEGSSFRLAGTPARETFPVDGVQNVSFTTGILPWDLQLSNGAVVNVTNATKAAGEQSLQYGNSSKTNGLGAVEGYTLTLSGQSRLNIYGQFMICGTNNTLIIDDSQIYVYYHYATYLGHGFGEGKSNSGQNTLIIRGSHPLIRSYALNANGQNYADATICNVMNVTFELPTDPKALYPEAVFQGGNSAWFYTRTYEFKNLQALYENLTSPVDIPLAMVDGTGVSAKSASFTGTPRVALPSYCSFVTKTDTTKNTYTVYLHIESFPWKKTGSFIQFK